MPRPPVFSRLRRWGVSALFVLASAALFYSAFGFAMLTRVRGSGSTAVGVAGGCVLVDWLADSLRASPPPRWLFHWEFQPSLSKAPEIRWRPFYRSGAPASNGAPWKYSTVVFPLWIPVVVLAGGTAWSWYGFLSRRRARAGRGTCTTCGYSRVGLEPSVACPECGGVLDNTHSPIRQEHAAMR